MPAGGDIILAEHVTYPAPQQAIDGTNQPNITAGTAVTGSPTLGVVFVVPVSGRVAVHVMAHAQITAGTAGPAAQVGVIVRSGATLLGGAVLHNGMTDDPGVSMIWQGTPPCGGKQASSIMLSGLTPGATHNAVVYHQTYGGTGPTFLIYNRAIRVEPLP